MKLFLAKEITKRKGYRSERMGRLRGEVMQWMQEYESAHTAKHREVCMNHIQMNLKKLEWYGHR
jgi:hypothetical protein